MLVVGLVEKLKSYNLIKMLLFESLRMSLKLQYQIKWILLS